jgi:ubiquinone/menaquinone biosynthesis C-methylase UbiE
MSGTAPALPSRVRRFGQVLYDRATGAADEMESAKSVCDIVAGLYAPGLNILDVGCGAGHYLRSLRERVDPKVDYAGVDLTAHYIDLAKKAFPDMASFSVGDACNIIFPDNSFDIVLCMNVVPNLPPPPSTAIGELLRVSREHVIIRTLFSDITYIIRELAAQGDTSDSPFAADGGIDESHALYNNMYTESYLRKIIEAASPGAIVDIEPDDHGAPIDNRTTHGAWGTRTEGGKQISGQLILDWRFAVVTQAERKK